MTMFELLRITTVTHETSVALPTEHDLRLCYRAVDAGWLRGNFLLRGPGAPASPRAVFHGIQTRCGLRAWWNLAGGQPPGGATTEDRLADLILEARGAWAPLRPETLLATDLGLDHVQMLELAMAIEHRFGVVMLDHEWDAAPRFGQALRLIEAKLGTKGCAA